MQLGNFSVSLATRDLAASRSFYEALGFRMIGGDPTRNWVILQSGRATIGLFQGMFERNILTFNPGWDADGQPLEGFDDVRDIQRVLAGRGIPLTATADASSTGPAHIMLVDPDGNPILIDQHLPRPQKQRMAPPTPRSPDPFGFSPSAEYLNRLLSRSVRHREESLAQPLPHRPRHERLHDRERECRHRREGRKDRLDGQVHVQRSGEHRA